MNFNDMMFGSGPGSIKHQKMMQALPQAIAPAPRSFTPGPMPQVPFMPPVNIQPQHFGGGAPGFQQRPQPNMDPGFMNRPQPTVDPGFMRRPQGGGMQDRLQAIFQQLMGQGGHGLGSPQSFGGFGNIPNIARGMQGGGSMARPGPTPQVPETAINLGFRPSFFGG